MSTVTANNHQVGNSGTASNNFTWYQPASPDGTVRLGQGNSGATTSDILVASSSGLFIGGSTVPASRIVQGTAQTTNGAASYGYTGIPSWVKRITFDVVEVYSNSGSGTATYFQVGSGSYVTTGYVTTTSTFSGAGGWGVAARSTGFSPQYGYSLGYKTSGQLILTLQNSTTNTWVASGCFSTPANPDSSFTVGSIALSGVLDRIQITTTSGTFTSGSVNIIYEG